MELTECSESSVTTYKDIIDTLKDKYNRDMERFHRENDRMKKEYESMLANLKEEKSISDEKVKLP